jgi:hypothetical protein
MSAAENNGLRALDPGAADTISAYLTLPKAEQCAIDFGQNGSIQFTNSLQEYAG